MNPNPNSCRRNCKQLPTNNLCNYLFNCYGYSIQSISVPLLIAPENSNEDRDYWSISSHPTCISSHLCHAFWYLLIEEIPIGFSRPLYINISPISRRMACKVSLFPCHVIATSILFYSSYPPSLWQSLNPPPPPLMVSWFMWITSRKLVFVSMHTPRRVLCKQTGGDDAAGSSVHMSQKGTWDRQLIISYPEGWFMFLLLHRAI